MHQTRVALLSLSAILISSFFMGTPVAADVAGEPTAKTEKTITTERQSSAAGAKDENIDQRSMLNDSKDLPEAPPSKGGTKSRSIYCGVVVDNYTPYKIQIYINRRYKGLVAPYGKMELFGPAGPTRLYARADFVDGHYDHWGPREMDLDHDSVYTWSLKA